MITLPRVSEYHDSDRQEVVQDNKSQCVTLPQVLVVGWPDLVADGQVVVQVVAFVCRGVRIEHIEFNFHSVLYCNGICTLLHFIAMEFAL